MAHSARPSLESSRDPHVEVNAITGVRRISPRGYTAPPAPRIGCMLERLTPGLAPAPVGGLPPVTNHHADLVSPDRDPGRRTPGRRSGAGPVTHRCGAARRDL